MTFASTQAAEQHTVLLQHLLDASATATAAAADVKNRGGLDAAGLLSVEGQEEGSGTQAERGMGGEQKQTELLASVERLVGAGLARVEAVLAGRFAEQASRMESRIGEAVHEAVARALPDGVAAAVAASRVPRVYKADDGGASVVASARGVGGAGGVDEAGNALDKLQGSSWACEVPRCCVSCPRSMHICIHIRYAYTYLLGCRIEDTCTYPYTYLLGCRIVVSLLSTYVSICVFVCVCVCVCVYQDRNQKPKRRITTDIMSGEIGGGTPRGGGEVEHEEEQVGAHADPRGNTSLSANITDKVERECADIKLLVVHSHEELADKLDTMASDLRVCLLVACLHMLVASMLVACVPCMSGKLSSTEVPKLTRIRIHRHLIYRQHRPKRHFTSLQSHASTRSRVQANPAIRPKRLQESRGYKRSQESRLRVAGPRTCTPPCLHRVSAYACTPYTPVTI